MRGWQGIITLCYYFRFVVASYCAVRNISFFPFFAEIAVQVLIVFVGGDVAQVTSLSRHEWGISLALGVVALPIGVAVRLLPNEPFEKLFTALRLLPKDDVLPTTQQQMEWSPAVDQVRDGLRTFGGLRGGRLRASSYVAKTRVAHVQTDAAHQVCVAFSGLVLSVVTV